jgi:hypothetical protein
MMTFAIVCLRVVFVASRSVDEKPAVWGIFKCDARTSKRTRKHTVPVLHCHSEAEF